MTSTFDVRPLELSESNFLLRRIRIVRLTNTLNEWVKERLLVTPSLGLWTIRYSLYSLAISAGGWGSGKDRLTSIRLTEPQTNALERISKRDDRSVSWLIRKAIDEFVKWDHEKAKSSS